MGPDFHGGIVSVVVVSRREALDLIEKKKPPFREPWSFISISSLSEAGCQASYRNSSIPYAYGMMDSLKDLGCQDALSLVFGDTSMEEYQQDPSACDSPPISEKQADDIIEFVRKQGTKHFLVHCYAGVSRSGAVGLWVVRELELVEEYFYAVNRHIHPNSYVMKMLEIRSGLLSRAQSKYKELFFDH